MVEKNTHEKLLKSIQIMSIDPILDLPYYGEFNLGLNFIEDPSIGTCAVNITRGGMNFYYAPKFLDSLTNEEVNFVDIHEIFHLLFNHPSRIKISGFNHKLSNIVQDMIINHIIWEDLSKLKTSIGDNFIEIPKDKGGKNMALFVPKEYEGKLIYEELYDWMLERKDEWIDRGSPDGEYGKFGKNPLGGYLDCWSTDRIFKNLENKSDYLDVHIPDEVSDGERESMIKDLINRIKSNLESRGLSNLRGFEETLSKLRKAKKDNLKDIKRVISTQIMGIFKSKTITKPNRKGILGIKGYRKSKITINVGLDTSGSMAGVFERVISQIYQSGIEFNFVEGDTEIKYVKKIKDKVGLKGIPIKGFGGTVLQPMIDYISDNFNEYNTVILTDGYTDSLDISKLKGRVLIITSGKKCEISKMNKWCRQIVLDGE